MISFLVGKLKNFLFAWAIYFVIAMLGAMCITFLIMPIVIYLRFGIIQFFPNPEFAIKFVKAVIYSSFALALVMWLYSECEAVKPKSLAEPERAYSSRSSLVSTAPELRDLRNTIVVSDLPSPSSAHISERERGQVSNLPDP